MLVKIKANIPEIILGVFLTVAVFAAGMVFESSRHPPFNNQEQRSAQTADQIGQKSSTDDRLADYAFALDVLTAFLVIATIGLLRATKRSAKIAERALTDLERPWALITNAGVQGIFSDPPFVEIEKQNIGRAGGIVRGVKAGFHISSSEIDVDSIKLTEWDLDEVGNLLAPDKVYTSKISFKPYKEPQVAAGIKAGAYNFILRAVLHYRGLTKANYETGFCFRYDAERERFVRHGGEQYNYTK
ncbi:MAG TPA: hypothetical protein VMV59_11510 [Candidatus Dormibacteraeota bacterium]|nr:hypothetical protein [Candidatus Dormibacteraeota bacterium]